jgi:hypothetical protein
MYVPSATCHSEVQPECARRLVSDIGQRHLGLLRYGSTTMRSLAAVLQQPAVLPQECQLLVDQLLVVRRQVDHCLGFLQRLPADLTEISFPAGCIARLESFSMRLFEVVLYVEMLSQVCSLVCDERIRIHMRLLALLPAIRAASDDTLTQLAAIAERARVAAEELEAVAGVELGEGENQDGK